VNTALLAILAAVIPSVIRNIAGWIENAFEDGKITEYEWKELAATTLRVGLISLCAFLGLGVPVVPAGAIGIVSDFFIKALKSR